MCCSLYRIEGRFGLAADQYRRRLPIRDRSAERPRDCLNWSVRIRAHVVKSHAQGYRNRCGLVGCTEVGLLERDEGAKYMTEAGKS